MSAVRIEVDVYSHRTGELVLLLRGAQCQACGNVVVGARLDEDGRCPGCVCAVQSCARCAVLMDAPDAPDRDGQALCLACAEERDADDGEQPHEHTLCCGGHGCSMCESTGYAG